MKIYADNCCFQRVFDRFILKKKLQLKVIEQAEAFAHVLGYVLESPSPRFDGERSFWGFVDSDVLRVEIRNCPSKKKREWVEGILTNFSIEEIGTDQSVRDRQIALSEMVWQITKRQASRLREQDACHLALAEATNADLLLTTDEQFHDWCVAMKKDVRVWVAYPQECLTTFFGLYGMNTFVMGTDRLRMAAKIKSRQSP